MKQFLTSLLSLSLVNGEDDIEYNMTPGGLPSPPVRRLVKCGKYDKILPDGEWEMILNAMVWTEGPAWWEGKLVFSDTRLGKIFSWDPETKLVGVVHERPGNDKWETGLWIEAGTNGLKYNPITDELLICQHGNRAIAAMDHNGAIRRIASEGPGGKRFNSPNDLTVHKSTGDIYFTDPVFGKMTFNANILRGNMNELPELDEPGFSGVYKIDAKSGEVTLVEDSMQQPNGIGITPDDKLIVAYCNETVWEWWAWQINPDGTMGKKEVLIDGTHELSGQGYPDGLDVDEEGNIWVSGPGGIYVYNKNGKLIGGEKFTTLATSNLFLGPDGYVYVTGNHGVYRKKRGDLTKDEL